MFGLSDVGRIRERNEDAVSWDVSTGLAIVADGIGGRRCGEVASGLAVETVRATLRESALARGNAPPREPKALLRSAVERCNETIFRNATETPEYRGMASTVAVALFERGVVTVSHVGDSRLYRLRDQALELLTTDHTLVTEMIANGYITAQEAVAHQHRNIVTRALGVSPKTEADVGQHTSQSGDVYLLCTDGLSNLVAESEIAATIGECGLDLAAASRRLVESANAHGGTDNISVLLVHIN
jgi:protein phosphatase